MTPINTKIHLSRLLGILEFRANILREGDPERYVASTRMS
jgi:hypothetical protein